MHEETFRQLLALLAILEHQVAPGSAALDAADLPALRRCLDCHPAMIASLQEDRRELDAMLVALARTLDRPAGPDRDEQIAVQARDLTDLLSIHLRKEESLVLGLAGHEVEPCHLAMPAARRPPAEETASGRQPAPPQKGPTE